STYLAIAGGGLLFAGFGVLSLVMGEPVSSAAVLVGFGGLVVAGAIAGWILATAKPRAMKHALVSLRLGAIRAGIGALLDWLDAHWTSTNPDLVRLVDVRCWSVAFDWRARPVLLVVTHDWKSRVDILVAGPRMRAPADGH